MLLSIDLIASAGVYNEGSNSQLETCIQKSDSDSTALMKIYKEATLGEVTVKGSRPLVKVQNGMLNYNLSVLTEKKAVNNVYEAITSLPGITDKDGTIVLAGSSSVTVIMNGRPTTMTPEQLNTLLHNMPVDRGDRKSVV